VRLALRSGIPFAAWEAEDDQTVATAFQEYRDLDEEQERRHG
jgi:hypothetical protein